MSKAQFSIEYISVYGFALITIFLVVGLLSVTFFAADSDVFEDCIFSETFNCNNFNIINDELILSVNNLKSVDLLVTRVTCHAQDQEPSSNDIDLYIANGKSSIITCNISNVPYNRLSLVVTINYLEQGGSSIRRTTGVITSSSPNNIICEPGSSSPVCQQYEAIELNASCVRESDVFTLVRHTESKTFYFPDPSTPYDVCFSKNFICIDGELSPPATTVPGPYPDSSFIYPECFADTII